MKKIIDWFFTLIFVPIFLLELVLFHPFLMLFNLFSYRVYAIMPNALMWVIDKSLYLTGASNKVIGKEVLRNLPKDRPLIIVSNHQSMFDISSIGSRFLKTHHVKFITKKKLGRGVPSISFNVRNGQHCLIDRKDKEGSIKSIAAFTEVVKKNNFAACIFAEGTRSRDGKLKPFKSGGFAALLNGIPNALIVPVAVDNFYKLTQYKLAPIPSFAKLKLHVMTPIEPNERDAKELLAVCESEIKKTLNQL